MISQLVASEDKPGGGPLGGVAEAIVGAVSGVKPVVDGINGAVNFASDPLGSIFKATRDGASGLAEDLMPALSKATEPDLSAGWFIQAYALTFALSIIVWGFLMIGQFISVSKGTLSGQEAFESMTIKSALFFGGVLFGPLIGVMVIKALGALSESLISWGIGSSSDRMMDTMTTMLDTESAALPGGVIVGILLMICMIIGLFVVVVMLAVMLVTLYFSGALAPLGMVWFVSAKHGSFGKKIPLLWLGILACHPLLFLMLGIAYNMVASSASWMTWSDGLATLMNIIASFIALMIAGFAPMVLLKFAPVMPAGAAGQGGLSVSPSSKSSHGPKDMKQAKDMNRSSGSDSQGQGGSGSKTNAPGGTAPMENAGSPSAGGGSLMQKLRELNGGKSNTDAGSDSAGAHSMGGSAKPGSPAPAGGMPKSGAGASPKVGAGAGASAGAGAGAGAASSSVAAAGASESSTGAGAVVGVPTLLAAGAMVVAEKAKEVGQKTAEAGAAGGEYAAAGMRDEMEGRES